MANRSTYNKKPNTNFDNRGTNVPTQPKVPPMPAPKPAKTTQKTKK